METKKMMRVFLSMAAFLGSMSVSVAQTSMTLSQNDFSIPAWTRLQRLVATMPQASAPFDINMTVNGDPSTRMGFAWFTNPSVTDGQVQIVAKPGATDADFDNPDFTFTAVSSEVKGLNYSIEKNKLDGVEPNQKIDYTSHKAVAVGLSPATTYSFRVGKAGAWSETGSFKTASGKNDESYSFIYITDTQAQNDDMFDVSQKTLHTAITKVPEAAFVLCNGDLVETSGEANSEWEYEQWFSTMQDVWMNYPLVVTMGNHDKSPNCNFAYHFSNSTAFNDNFTPGSDMNGTVFSFVRGDVLFLVISYEDWNKEGYLNSLAAWMRQEVEAHKDVKWRVASFHKNMFTGSRSHQDDADGKAVRQAMLPVFDELGINIALQGHDHIYEVIGPVNNVSKALSEGSVEKVETVGDGGERENMTGKTGGVFNVSKGTLYFLNNSAGKKKYEPRTEAEMTASFSKHEIENYWGLFSGKFGQTGEPTFSRVDVTPQTITFSTYTVDDLGNATLFDSFSVVKETSTGINEVRTPAGKAKITSDNDIVTVEGMNPDCINIYNFDGMCMASADNTAQVSVKHLPASVYIVRAKQGAEICTAKITIDR